MEQFLSKRTLYAYHKGRLFDGVELYSKREKSRIDISEKFYHQGGIVTDDFHQLFQRNVGLV